VNAVCSKGLGFKTHSGLKVSKLTVGSKFRNFETFEQRTWVRDSQCAQSFEVSKLVGSRLTVCSKFRNFETRGFETHSVLEVSKLWFRNSQCARSLETSKLSNKGCGFEIHCVLEVSKFRNRGFETHTVLHTQFATRFATRWRVKNT